MSVRKPRNALRQFLVIVTEATTDDGNYYKYVSVHRAHNIPPLRSVILTQISSGSGQCSPQNPMPRQLKLSAHPGVADVH